MIHIFIYINDYILYEYIDIYLCKCIMYRHIGPSPFPHPMPSFRKKSQDTVASALDVNQPGIQNQIWNLESGNFCGMIPSTLDEDRNDRNLGVKIRSLKVSQCVKVDSIF